MPEFVRCTECRALIFEGPTPAPADDSLDVPDGWRPAYHLCTECVVRLQARRNPTWGWLVRIPGPTHVKSS